MSWRPHRKLKTEDYECVFFNVDGVEHRFEIPFRTLDLTCTKISTSIFDVRDHLPATGKWGLKRKKVIHGTASLDDLASIGIIGNDEFKLTQVKFSIHPKESSPEDELREKAYLAEQDKFHFENTIELPLQQTQRTQGVPNCFLVRDSIDVLMDSLRLEEIYQNLVFGGATHFKFSIQFWKIYCQKDLEVQRNNFKFLLCPSEDGDVWRPQIAEGRLFHLALTKHVL